MYRMYKKLHADEGDLKKMAKTSIFYPKYYQRNQGAPQDEILGVTCMVT